MLFNLIIGAIIFMSGFLGFCISEVHYTKKVHQWLKYPKPRGSMEHACLTTRVVLEMRARMNQKMQKDFGNSILHYQQFTIAVARIRTEECHIECARLFNGHTPTCTKLGEAIEKYTSPTKEPKS